MGSIVIAAGAIVALLTVPATAVQAQEWCGYGLHDKSIIECGYSSLADCESTTGKDGVCFVDPELALDTSRRRFAMLLPTDGS
jgi:hypothetical protein